MRGSAAFRLSPTPGGVIGPIARDPDARDYIRRVAAADGQPLEPLVQRAIDAFVRGCKADGTWPAIKASCIMAGARTLSGALVPLVGTAPTNNNFVAGDYNRETGLVGDGITKYLDSNRNNNADPQNSKHVSIYVSGTPSDYMLGMGAPSGNGASLIFSTLTRLHSIGSDTFTATSGFIGLSRSASDAYSVRNGSNTSTVNKTSTTPQNANIFIYNNAAAQYASARLAFYSIGEALDLALLDARVTDLINAIGAAL